MRLVNEFIIFYYGLVHGLLLTIGMSLTKYSSNKLDPEPNTKNLTKRETYYKEIYFKQIEPVVVKLFTKYQCFISVNDKKFDNFHKIIQKISKIPKENRNEKLPVIKNLFDQAQIFESLPGLTLYSDIIRNLIKSCKNFEKYNITFKKIKYIGLGSLIFMIFHLIMIITFYFTLD